MLIGTNPETRLVKAWSESRRLLVKAVGGERDGSRERSDGQGGSQLCAILSAASIYISYL
jgi:hypothetical protein